MYLMIGMKYTSPGVSSSDATTSVEGVNDPTTDTRSIAHGLTSASTSDPSLL